MGPNARCLVKAMAADPPHGRRARHPGLKTPDVWGPGFSPR